MQAIVMTGVGGPEVLVAREVGEPSPQPGEVLIRVEAVPVLYPETMLRSGMFPTPTPTPAVFGTQAVGVVTAVAEDVDPEWQGQRVLVARNDFGSYAEWMCAPAESAVRVPDGLASDAAAAVAMSGSVALALLEAAALTGTDTVLIEAAATGIGGYLTQLAARSGAAHIIATAGGAAKTERARELGAHTVVDHRDPDWPRRLGERLENATVDVVFDSIGGESAAAVLDVMTPLRGRMLGYGWLSGAPAQVTTMDLIMRGLTFTGCSGAQWLAGVAAKRAAAFELAAAGDLTVLIDSVLPLADAAEAHRRVDERTTFGTIVLRPGTA
ncbi:dehydrogenase [Nocardia sp. 852002-20019_SCH5090214]|uniref:quinone oxidoreductase family protein n=1 Tax=Nocardia sp. 852002-20019_SCH5090214 TaxID=1834087 RepID=UPI0007E957B0|nr:zinc-binding dehydrogenase [Nocardia sp. 852002-20019_SCH5090214]OBA50166.1 dehydrogenase [Nocardia sp. 852002-20019_SCH5090214]